MQMHSKAQSLSSYHTFICQPQVNQQTNTQGAPGSVVSKDIQELALWLPSILPNSILIHVLTHR